ncbi:hypothetical protein L218DRAFT_1007777 [Marasmius fiardii PR-910]|nr:hypothetical protein L218DRAFT_1007777 [Marasmius fiardii PR-910]
MAPSKNKHAPTAESPPPVPNPTSASTNISSVPLLHMWPSAHFTRDTKLYKLLETVREAFHDLYICWAMASTFRMASNKVNVGGYEVPSEYLQFMLSVSRLADKLCHLSFITPPLYLENYYSSDDIDELKESLGNNYWDFRERLPLPPKKPLSTNTSKASSGKARRVQSPVVIKKEVSTDKRAHEPSPGPVNKKPKLDISPTNTLFGSESGESEAAAEEDIEEEEAECDELEVINQFSDDEAEEASPAPTHFVEPAPSVAASSKGKGKAKAVMAPSKVIKKKMNATASISEEQPNLRVIYVPGTEAAPITFEQLATLSTIVYKPSPATMDSKKTNKCELCDRHGQKCSVAQNLNNVLPVFNRLFQIGLQGPEGLGMLLSQCTQLFEACHQLSGIRVLLDAEVNRIHTQIDELTATIKRATRDPCYVAHMLNADDPNHSPLSGDEVAILASALEWPTSMFSSEDTEVVVISENEVQVKDKAQGSVIATAPFVSRKAEADALTSTLYIAFMAVSKKNSVIPCADCDAWMGDTKRCIATAEALLAFDSVPVRDTGLKDFMLHLKARLNPHHIAVDQEAYDLYMAAFNLMQKHLDHGDIIPNLIMLNSIKAFHTSVEELRKQSAPAPKTGKSPRIPKTPQYIVSDSDDNDEVIINQDADMADGTRLSGSLHAPKSAGKRGKSPAVCPTTVSIPYAQVPGMDLQSRQYLKAMYYLLQDHATCNASKKVKFDKPMTDLRQEDLDEHELCLHGNAQVTQILQVIPFMELAKVPMVTLTSYANFLRNELYTLHHSIVYYGGQHKMTTGQLEEVERELVTRPDGGSTPAGNAPDEAGPSGSQASSGNVQEGPDMSVDPADIPVSQ